MKAKEIIKLIYENKSEISVRDFSMKLNIEEKDSKEILEAGVRSGVLFEITENIYGLYTIVQSLYEGYIEYGNSPRFEKVLFEWNNFIDEFYSRIEDKKLLSEKEIQERKELRSEVIELISGRDKRWDKATELLEQYILKNNYIYTTKDDKQTEAWIYENGIYTPQGKSEIKKQLRKLMDSFYSIYLFNRVWEKIEPDTFINADDFFQVNYINEVPVKNGILNLKTKKLIPFDPNKIFFNKLQVEYNPEAKCPKVEHFLSDILSKSEDRKVFYELGGFTLWKDYTFEKAFMFVGNGRNGKDKSLELIKRLLGVDNCCSIPLAAIVPDSFIISEFYNKMCNLAGEISNSDLKDTTAFKGLTGRSLFSAPRKFLTPLHFVNYAKFIFACNDLPMVYDNSKGFWDRWVLLEFPYTFVTQREYDNADDKTNLKLRDERIIDKITTPGELSGLLNKFLEGLDRLMKNKEFSKTEGSDEVKKIWIRKSNSVMAFIMDNIDESYDKFISKKKFRLNYAKYCRKHKIAPKSDFVIKRTLQDMYGVSDERKEMLGGLYEWVWTGIKWRDK